MVDNDIKELQARCEALARLNMQLLVMLEDTGVIDGHHLQEAVVSGLPHGTATLDRSADLLLELMSNYSDARATRRTRAMSSRNRRGPDLYA